jgi:hypothetical protein
MRRDRALGISIAATIAYAIAMATTSFKPTALSMSATRPVSMLATFAATGQTLRIDDPPNIAAVSRWLDDALTNPRSDFDVQILPPPVNQLDIEFQSGEHTTIYFSGRTGGGERAEALRRIRYPGPIYVVKHDGACFTIDGVPEVFAGYLELTETPPIELGTYRRPYRLKPLR